MHRRLPVLLLFSSVLALMCTAAFGWKFASMADSQGFNNGVNTVVLTKLVNQINTEHVDFVIFQGDAITGSADDAACGSQMNTWLSIMGNLNCPWYFVPGNHDIQSPTAQENVLRSRVNQPLNGPSSDLEMVYWFDYQNARFIGLNSDHYGQQHLIQKDWLRSVLQNTTQPLIFVMAHEAAYGGGLDAYPSERDEFWSILTQYGVNTYFCGHRHYFHRALYGSVYQVVNGGAGGELVTGVPGTIAQYHYVVVEVIGLNLYGWCKSDTGAILDSWTQVVTPPTLVTCGQARLLPDGTNVTLQNKIVTYVKDNAFYIQEDDRSAGFRVTGVSGIAVGDRVNVTGLLATNSSGEREIQGSASKLSSGNPAPAPLVITNKAQLGGPLGYNPGAEGAVGCHNSGLLVKITGRVTAVGTGADAYKFYIDDGSGVADGTSWAGVPNKGVRVLWQGTVAVGEYRVVTGISSAFKNGSNVCRQIICTDRVVLSSFTAYNDCVYSSSTSHCNPALMPNVTTYNIGIGSPGPSSGTLKNFTNGIDTGVTLTLTQSGGVIWQPNGCSPSYDGGADCNTGTDARNVFSSMTASLVGLTYYGSTGWWVDATFTGLDPDKKYEFITSANRHKTDGTYEDRLTKYTISGADSFANSSTPGVTIGDGGASSTFCTGNNTTRGYVARWTDIRCGADGSFKVRAEAGSAQNSAYAFSAIKLIQRPL